jgi:hypothetical protein
MKSNGGLSSTDFEYADQRSIPRNGGSFSIGQDRLAKFSSTKPNSQMARSPLAIAMSSFAGIAHTDKAPAADHVPPRQREGVAQSRFIGCFRQSF